MLKIVCDDKIPFIKGALEPYAEIVYLPGAKTGRAELKDADAVITRTRTRCDASTLDGTAVKFIATATIGYDHIDTEYCAGKGIFWTNAPGCNSSSVAQYICSLLLRVAIKRRISLKGMTLGVVGAGNVGSKVAKVGRALGMRVLLNDPPRAKVEGSEGFASLEEVQAEADFIRSTCRSRWTVRTRPSSSPPPPSSGSWRRNPFSSTPRAERWSPATPSRSHPPRPGLQARRWTSGRTNPT
jgi:erythronate-4-phosphate dehydrogenase